MLLKDLRGACVDADDSVTGVIDRYTAHADQLGVLGAKQRPLLGGQAFGWDREAPGSSA